jgi:hypothetical protein
MIMNPMTRKMFKSRDARTKLRGMGGILASSPELAQTVQQFQDGGNVDGGFGSNVEYTYSTFLAENNLNDTPQAREMFAKYKVYMDTREAPSSPKLFSPVGFDRAPAALGDAPMTSAVEFDPNRQFSQPAMPSAPAGLAALSVEPDAEFTRQTSPAAPLSTLDQLRSSVYSTNPLEDALAGTGLDSNVIGTSVIDPVMGRFAEATSRDPMQSPTAADVAAEVALRNRERASEDAGRLTAEELMSSDPTRPGAAPELTAEELAMQAYAESLAQQYAPVGEDLQSMDDTLARAGEAVSELGQRLVAPKVGSKAVTFPGAEGRAIIRGDLTAAEMMPPPPVTPALPAEERRMDYVPEGDTPVVEAPAPAAETETTADGDAGTSTSTSTLNVDPEKLAPLMPQPGDTDADVRAKYKDRLKLFQEILGEDEAGARNKGMDLAMIGLAIMSGQSPNFLTNIAQGGAAGLKAMSARDEAARERQRLLRTTALESVLDEEAAATAAAATAAEKERDRQTRLEVARIGADGGADYTPAELVTYRTAYNAAFKAATERGAKPQAVKDGMSPEDYATQMANSAVTSSRTFFSGEAQPSVQPPPSAVRSPQELEAAQKLEAAAKAAGSPTFVFNGDEYPVR